MIRMRVFQRLFHARSEAALRPFGLNIAAFEVLQALRRSGEPYCLNPTQLREGMMLSSGAVTNRVDRLEERGLVRREPDKEDRRGVIVCLTEEGLRVAHETLTAQIENTSAVVSCLSRDELETLDRLLRKLLVSAERP